MGVFIDGNVLGYSFGPPKKYKLTKQAKDWCTRILHGIVWTSTERLNYSGPPKIFPRDVKGQYFAKRQDLCHLLDKEVKNLDEHGCPKVQNLVDEEMWINSSFLFRHKTTLHYAEREAKSFVTR